MTATLRERAQHAAKYGTHLVIPARDILKLLQVLDKAEASIEAVEDMLDKTDASAREDPARMFNGDPFPAILRTSDIRRALDGDA